MESPALPRTQVGEGMESKDGLELGGKLTGVFGGWGC